MFTFKKQPRATGLARVAERSTSTEIKIKGKAVGLIDVPLMFDDNVRIRFMVKCDEHPGWKWVKLKAGFDTESDARVMLNNKFDYIQANFDLYHQDL